MPPKNKCSFERQAFSSILQPSGAPERIGHNFPHQSRGTRYSIS
jgi:hypothetical protein